MDKAIILAIGMILLLVISLQFILYSVPYFQRIAFDAACHRALMMMDHAGGLTASIQMQLEADLQERNLFNLEIHGDTAVPFGEEIMLVVQADLKTRHISPLLKLQETRRTFTYQNRILSRHILTSAGEP